MIHVDRDAIPVPAVLDENKPHRAGPRETARAKLAYEKLLADSKKQPSDFKFSFDAYSRKEVRKALTLLFHGKCAYCEKRFAATQPPDVEHWRPKGEAIRDGHAEMKPGYYWLAADWENLLPSCIDCNRARYQKIPPDDQEVLSGKGNQFPILDEAQRCLNHQGDIQAEVPLLLDPCRDQPKEYLRFTREGFVRPRTTEPQEESAADPAPLDPALRLLRAKMSIRVYALNREGLIFDRQEVLKLIEFHKFTVTGLMEALADEDLPAKWEPLLEILLDNELRALRWFMAPQRSFCQMARQLIGDFFESMAVKEPVEKMP